MGQFLTFEKMKKQLQNETNELRGLMKNQTEKEKK